MREQCRFRKAGLLSLGPGPGNYRRGHARNFAEQHLFAAQRQRDEGGARLHDLEAELPCQIIGEAGRAHFGDRRAAGRDNQRRGGMAIRLGRHREPRLDGIDLLATTDRHLAPEVPRPRAFFQQHVDDLLRRSVTEQLAQSLFVPGDPMAFDHVEEIARRVSRQRGFGEMRVGRQVIGRSGAEIGEIAAPAARDQDLLADTVRPLDHEHAAAPLSGARGRHQPGGARTQDYRIVSLRLPIHHPTGSVVLASCRPATK